MITVLLTCYVRQTVRKSKGFWYVSWVCKAYRWVVMPLCMIAAPADKVYDTAQGANHSNCQQG